MYYNLVKWQVPPKALTKYENENIQRGYRKIIMIKQGMFPALLRKKSMEDVK